MFLSSYHRSNLMLNISNIRLLYNGLVLAGVYSSDALEAVSSRTRPWRSRKVEAEARQQYRTKFVKIVLWNTNNNQRHTCAVHNRRNQQLVGLLPIHCIIYSEWYFCCQKLRLLLGKVSRPIKEIVHVKVFISRHIWGANVEVQARPRQPQGASMQSNCLEDYITGVFLGVVGHLMSVWVSN